MDGEEYMAQLKQEFYKELNKCKLDVPKRWNKEFKTIVHYEIEDLNRQQADVVIMAMDEIIKFLNNYHKYEPFRATVIGAGGFRKSHLIDALVSIIRQYTQINQSVMVTAPLEAAAYNIGGSTLHRRLICRWKVYTLQKIE